MRRHLGARVGGAEFLKRSGHVVDDSEQADLYLVRVDTHVCGRGEERADARLEAALRHIRKKHRYWDHSNGLDHVWLLSHPRGCAACTA